MSDTFKIQQIANQVIERNPAFEAKADGLMPRLFEQTVDACQRVSVVEDSNSIHGWGMEVLGSAKELASLAYGKGEGFVLDFGSHCVGYIGFRIKPVGSPPDAPLRLKLTFGEMPVELAEPFSSYSGWVSSSWLQEETLFVDVLPTEIKLPRRYSFRYVKFEVQDTSPKYRVSFSSVQCQTVTSANPTEVSRLIHADPELQKIDEVSIKTLQDCMQAIFEDGPKRDRRLWLGDLRLQALANYETFQTNGLVKRCLYLFAAVPDDKGRVAANLFTNPSLIPDDTYLFDYSLLFVSTLHDYYFSVKDRDTLMDLWGTAYRQIEVALERLDERDIVSDDDLWWSFIDWHEDLNKQAASQAVLMFALKHAIFLAEALGSSKTDFLKARLQEIKGATITHLWDAELQFFVSGSEKQVSWASQIWMVMAGALEEEESRALLNRLITERPAIGLTTPYLYHYLVEALILVGEKGKAVGQIKAYWGEMLRDGADTFWEVYQPEDKTFSPYGSHLINSYCHAWSCTPTYLIRKYQL